MDNPNIKDLHELEALIDFRIAKAKGVYEAHTAAVLAKDPAWPVDWSMLLGRYKTERDSLDQHETLSLPDATPIDAETYDGLLRSVQQVPMQRTKGDLSDLISRLDKAGFPVSMNGQPQPSRTFGEKLLEATNPVPTPGDLWTYAKWAAALYFADHMGWLDGFKGKR